MDADLPMIDRDDTQNKGMSDLERNTSNEPLRAMADPEDATTVSMRTRRCGVVFAAMLVSLVVALAYVVYQRCGTIANVDLIEFTPNLAGGFLAIGMSESQPGIMILSTLDRKDVKVTADRYSNRIAGSHTTIEIGTSSTTWQRRLRGPLLILIDSRGVVEGVPLDWTVEEFGILRDAADCARSKPGKKLRCGAPFADLHDTLANWPVDRVPVSAGLFLAPYGRSDSVAGR